MFISLISFLAHLCVLEIFLTGNILKLNTEQCTRTLSANKLVKIQSYAEGQTVITEKVNLLLRGVIFFELISETKHEN